MHYLKLIAYTLIKLLYHKYYILLLALIVCVSYGQMIFMNVWQDDQALFFKLAHIDQAPGFFGPGPFGSGPYKYAATPFIPIYHLFEFNTYAYFTFLFFLYLLTTLVIYKTFSLVLGATGGKVAGFIYAAGYVTSDGFWRMANSATTSISIILVSLFLYSYWKFRSSNKLSGFSWYAIAIFIYWLVSELAITRVHYFIGVVIVFEIIFFAFRRLPASIIYSIVRLVPFAFIVYQSLIANADQRTAGVKEFFTAIFAGKLHYYYGYLSSLANLVFPDWLTEVLFAIQNKYYIALNQQVPINSLVVVIFGGIIYLIFLKHKSRIPLTLFFLTLEVVWYKLAVRQFNTPLLNLGQQQLLILFIGGMCVIIALATLIILKGSLKKIYLLLVLWVLGNTAAYSAYFPTIAYETTNRYLAHSFVALVGIYGLIFTHLLKQGFIGRVGATLIILTGVINITQAIYLENHILKNRSIPTKTFFSQLQSFLPKIQNGDIIYIDVADAAAGLYQDAVSAAMMPDTTAFAWRYGIDRYDFTLVNNFEELQQLVVDKQISAQQVHGFWYDGTKLTNTSDQIRRFLASSPDIKDKTIQNIGSSSITQIERGQHYTTYTTPNLVIALDEPINSAVPTQISVNITAASIPINQISFPFSTNILNNTRPSTDTIEDATLSLQYQKFKSRFYQTAEIQTSSEWRERLTKNINDQDETTTWQSDRVLWADKTATVTIILPNLDHISKFVWINGFPNNTPTTYRLESSVDNRIWNIIKQINNPHRIEATSPQVIEFPPQEAKYIKMTITDTIGGDSPSIAEAWVVPSAYANLNINRAEIYLHNPLLYVPDSAVLNLVMGNLQEITTAKLGWKNNKTRVPQSNKGSELRLLYDGIPHAYLVDIPAGGTNISQLMLTNLIVPGTVTVNYLDIKQRFRATQ